MTELIALILALLILIALLVAGVFTLLLILEFIEPIFDDLSDIARYKGRDIRDKLMRRSVK